MSHDISTNRLFLISCIGTSGSIRVGHDLIGDDNRNAELRIRVPSALDQAGRGTHTSSANLCNVRKNLPK